MGCGRLASAELGRRASRRAGGAGGVRERLSLWGGDAVRGVQRDARQAAAARERSRRDGCGMSGWPCTRRSSGTGMLLASSRTNASLWGSCRSTLPPGFSHRPAYGLVTSVRRCKTSASDPSYPVPLRDTPSPSGAFLAPKQPLVPQPIDSQNPQCLHPSTPLSSLEEMQCRKLRMCRADILALRV